MQQKTVRVSRACVGVWNRLTISLMLITFIGYGTVATNAAEPAAAQASKGVNDTSHFFSADVKAKVEVISKRADVQVSIETFDSLPADKDMPSFATARGKDAPIKGIRLIIVRKGGHVSVRADPATSKVFDGNVQQELAKRLNAGLRKGTQHFDEALLDAVAFIDGKLGDSQAIAKGVANPQAAANALLGDWESSSVHGNTLAIKSNEKGMLICEQVVMENGHPARGLGGMMTLEPNGMGVMAAGWRKSKFTYDPAKRTLRFDDGRVYERIVPKLVLGLKSEEKKDRAEAEGRLSQIRDLSGDAEVILPELLRMAKDPDPDLRERGLRVLGLASPSTPTSEAISAIQQGFKDKEVAVIGSAAVAAGRVGKGAGPVIPQLIEALKLPNTRVRISVANAFWGDLAALPGTDAAVPLLISILADTKADNADNKLLRDCVIGAFGRIGPRAKESVPVLVALLKDEDKAVRQETADSLGGIGPAAADALPALIEMAKSDLSQEARKHADAAIKLIQL